jgi:hypothetical protein
MRTILVAAVAGAVLGTAALFPMAKVGAVPLAEVALVGDAVITQDMQGRSVHDKATKCVVSVKSLKAVHDKVTKCVTTGAADGQVPEIRTLSAELAHGFLSNCHRCKKVGHRIGHRIIASPELRVFAD